MAVGLSAHEVSDLCIGKPPLRPLPLSATVGDALLSLKLCGESSLSVWAGSPPTSPPSFDKKATAGGGATCVGKVCIVDVICYLCKEENQASPSSALTSPVSTLLTDVSVGLVRHVDRHSSVVEALDLILDGAQNLVVPLQAGATAAAIRKKRHPDALALCWLTPEDFVRFFLNSIGVFSPVPTFSVDSLGLVRPDALAVGYDEPALSAVPLIREALASQTAVAVVTDDGKLVGEISPTGLAGCDETVAAAIATLSAGELMAYVGCGADQPEEAVEAVKARLRQRGMAGMLELFEEDGSTLSDSSLSSGSSSGSLSSSDEESAAPAKGRRSRRHSRRGGRRGAEEAVVCHRKSSLVAVMMQALAHRASYVWVVEADYRLAGVVMFSDVLKVFRDLL